MSSRAITVGWTRPRSAGGRARRFLDIVASFLFVCAGTALVLLAAAVLSGRHPMVDYSDSMAPTIRAGDVIFVHGATAAEARPGDIVTFVDPSRAGETLTHRVVRITERGGRLRFVTRGDANTGTERWAIDPTGKIGIYSLRVPAAGRILAPFSTRGAWLICVVIASVMLAGSVVRRIWTR